MVLELQQATLVLAAGRFIRLHAARGTRVRCIAGTVWVTQSGESRDAFLTSGEGMVVRSRALTLVESCGEATVVLRSAAVTASEPPLLRRWLRWVPYY